MCYLYGGSMKKILLIILGVIVIVGCIIFWMFQKQTEDVQNLEYANIVMNDVVDGTYEGHIETMLIKVKVNVTVENHSLKNIEILQHDNGFGEPAEEIVKTMIQKNNYQVDVKSGATYSSEIIKSAVSRALQKGVHKNG